MRVRDLVYETASALDANRGRSLLTILGVVIGISAVIAMTALIGGIKQAMVSELGLGKARLVTMYCWYGRDLRLDDVQAMESDLVDDYEYVTPMTGAYAEVASDTKTVGGNIHGTQDTYDDAMGLKLVAGRFFNEKEAATGELVCVLDQVGVKELFGSVDADVVGKSVRFGGVPYLVCGVLEAPVTGREVDSIEVYMPFMTCANRIIGWTSVDQVLGFAREGSDMEAVATHSREWFANRLQIPEDEQENSIYVVTSESIIKELDATMMSFEVLMTSVASISLLVGGIGIMNMMLTNVTERIREIGLRKALGARSRDITRQFLLESVCLTLVGGVLGMAVGYLGAFALSGLAAGMISYGEEGTAVTPYLDLKTMLMVAGICVGIGVLFGYYPARRAAKLDPVESLHYQ